MTANEWKREFVWSNDKSPLRFDVRSVPTISIKGFRCFRYAVHSRGSCLRSERCADHMCYSGHTCTVGVRKAVYLSNWDNVTALPYMEFGAENREHHGNKSSGDCAALLRTPRFTKDTVFSPREGTLLRVRTVQWYKVFVQLRRRRGTLKLISS